jgi:uncharacterized protein YlxW (UPF0749 family)
VRKYIWPIILLAFVCIVWKSFDFYICEQRRKHDSAEREKDRELQREIMKAKQKKENKAEPK